MKYWQDLLGNKRLLLVIYLVALLGLSMFPIDVPEFRLLGIEADKWMHFVFFSGLAIFLQWNLSARRHSVLISIGAAFVIAVAKEIAQSVIEYRSAEWWDLAADLFGAVFGALLMRRFLSSHVAKKSVGLLMAILGVNVGAFFVLADLIVVGGSEGFGTIQMVGTALSAQIVLGGVTLTD